jgi:hypothetical protein
LQTFWPRLPFAQRQANATPGVLQGRVRRGVQSHAPQAPSAWHSMVPCTRTSAQLQDAWSPARQSTGELASRSAQPNASIPLDRAMKVRRE